MNRLITRTLLVAVLVGPLGTATAAEQGKAAAPKAEAPKRFTNSIGMQMVPIPAGEFMMGSVESLDELLKTFPAYKVAAKTDYLFQDEFPQHHVRITRPFYFSQCEVTFGQFKQFAQDSGYKTQAETDGKGGWGYNAKTGKCEGRFTRYNWCNPGFAQTDDHPVVNVTWHDAVAFCEWLSRKEGKTYRLPTEAQWEYACRGGTHTRYNNGDDPQGVARVAHLQDAAGRSEFPHVQEILMPQDAKFTAAVGTLPANGFGLNDMHGNVWEWCADWYGKDYYAKSPVDDPQGPETGLRRIRRGGAWNSFPLYARASFRNWNRPDSRCVNLGFRPICE